MVEFPIVNYAINKAVSFIRTLVVKENDEGQRIDKFLQKSLNNIPQSLLYKYFRKKCIKINDRKAQPEEIIKSGDEIKLFISDEFFEKECDSFLAIRKILICIRPLCNFPDILRSSRPENTRANR